MKDNLSTERITELIEEAYPWLERFALTICKSKEEAKDVVGETMLVAFEKYKVLKDEKAFISYLFTIASRVKVNLYRKTYKYKSTESEAFDLLQSTNLSPEDLTDIKFLLTALDELNYKQKEAVVLYDINGLNYKEIAKVQNSSLSAVKLRIHRGRKTLAKKLNVENDLNEQSPNNTRGEKYEN